jgi:hypothetical protein
MTLNFFASIACASAAFASVLTVVSLLRKYDCFTGIAERWLVAAGVFFVSVGLGFSVLSLFPVDAPLRVLALPVHFALLLWAIYSVGMSGLQATVLELLARTYNTLRRMHPLWYPALIVFALLMVAYAIQGIFTVPMGVDELSYHVPQAVGMVQEGRVRSFNAPPVWIYHYPQGAASLWAWTMLFTGGDYLFRLVQFGFGIQLLLATGLLARRSGSDNIAALLAVLTVVTMPIFYVLTTTVGADLGFAAAVVSGLAFLAPPCRHPDDKQSHDLLAASLFFAQAALIKIPVLALIFFSIAGGAFIWGRIGISNVGTFLRRIAVMPIAWATFMVVVFSGSVYALNWLETNNPMFPLTLRVGESVLFKGPLAPIENIVMGHSTFGDVSKMSYLRRWHAVFADWFQPLNQDSFGSAGPIFLASTLFMAALGLLQRLRERNAWSIALALIVASVFFLPASHLPRYTLAWFCVLAAAASLAYTYVRRTLTVLPILIVTILLGSLSIQLDNMTNTWNWIRSMSAPEPWYVDRGRSIVEKIDIDRTLAPTGAMVKAIRQNVRGRDVLSFSVRVHSTLMWNGEYSNTIRFLAVGPNENNLMNPSFQDQQTWLLQIRETAPDWVLVYSGSGLSKVLLDKGAGNYAIAFSDQVTGSEVQDRWNMTLLRRVAQQPTN